MESPIKNSWANTRDLTVLNREITELFYKLEKKQSYEPFWDDEKEQISNNIWFPNGNEKINTVIRDQSSKQKKDHSWFSIKKKFSSEKQDFNHKEYLFPKPEKVDTSIKTLKIRIFPTDTEKEDLNLLFQQYIWYYNVSVEIFTDFYEDRILDNNKYHFSNERDLMKKYRYQVIGDKKKHVFDPKCNEVPVPDFWKGKLHNRVPRGANRKFIMAVNSALSNLKAGNISKFEMKRMKKKYDREYIFFEDSCYPGFINKIKSHYWYTDRDHRRKKVSLKELELQKKGLEIIHEKMTDKYFIHYPVKRDWFPEDDRRNEKQESLVSKGNRVISLDPGIRKFLVGYDPKGKAIFIAQDAKKRLIELLLEIDIETIKGKKMTRKIIENWKKLKNLVSELHWKVINFLIKNYDIILLPDFRISQMVRGYKLARITKRLMYMFSFHSFKEKLKWKCSIHDKQLIIVNESYTSKTCGFCGILNDVGGNEHYSCDNCKMEIDRDVNGARNIFIKNIALR